MAQKFSKLLDDCFLHDSDRLKHGEALKILEERLSPIAGTEGIELANLHRRIAAQTIAAPRDIPAHDNSAVDGFAYKATDFEMTGGIFPLSGRVAAGDVRPFKLDPASAVRIFTGAPMPEGSDTVAMQEDCNLGDVGGRQVVEIPVGLKTGANRRLAGEDLHVGNSIVNPGDILRSQDVGALASAGITGIEVYKPLRVALISSGNELLRPGEKFEAGKVYDANHFMISSLLKNTGAKVVDLGICPDKRNLVEALLTENASNHDVMISTGGASKGEEDYLIETLEKIGKCHLWQLAIKPGRPMGFGQIGDAVAFVLPGNPVAAFVCFLLYVRPALLNLAGASWQEPVRYPLPAGFEMPNRKTGRREFLRGKIGKDTDGNTIVKKYGNDGSGLISGLRESDGLIEINEDEIKVELGDAVNFIPYREFGID